MDPVVIGLTFAAIFLVELPDKTFIATLVLATRFRPILVWIGVGLAFAVQTAVAVALGKAASLLPEDLVHAVAGVVFLIGAIVLFREARKADEEEAEQEAEYATKAGDPKQGLKAVAASFLVLFAAEWGDLSQLLTLSLVAKYDDPVSVFVGALAALLAVSGLAVLLGRWLLSHIRLRTLHYIGGGCASCWSRSRRTSCWPDHTRWTPPPPVGEDRPTEGCNEHPGGRGVAAPAMRKVSMPIFDGFTDQEVDRIKNAGTFVTLPADWSPIWEKTPADKAYIVLSGEVSVRRNGDEIARLGPGDIMGEAAIVQHSLRTASIVSLTKLEVLHFTDDKVRSLCEEVPAFREAIDRTARERIGAPDRAE